MLELIPLAVTLVAFAGYGTGLHRLRRLGVRWPATRVAAMLAGSFCTAAAVLPPIASHDELFPVHVGQHLLLGMAAPAFLALSAPVTLALRTLPRRRRRILLRLLHSFPVAVLAAPATAVVLDLGGLYALYLTGLYQAAEHNDLVHAAVHVHMFLAGCLFSWAVIGLDPVRRRPGTWVRLTGLIIAAAGHDTLAKLIYARNLPAAGGPIASRHTGAELMYYGGTVIEVALAAIVMAQWYLASGRALARTRRRPESAGPQLAIALSSRRRGWAPLPLSHLGRISRGARAGHKRDRGRNNPGQLVTGVTGVTVRS
jgi:putative membrane protein